MASKYLPIRVAIAKRAPAPDAEAVELAKLDALLEKMDEDEADDEEQDEPASVAKKGTKMPMEDDDSDLDELESMLDEEDDDEAMPPRKSMKKAEREPLTKREAQLMKRLDQLEKREKQRTLLTKAVQLVGEAPVQAEEVVKVLGVLVDDADALKAFSSIMKRFSALAEGSGIFTAVGTSDDEGEAATTELTKVAVTLRKKDPKLTAQQAIAKALELHPELYESYIGGDVSADDLALVGADTDGEE
jgi:hypothetical protein